MAASFTNKKIAWALESINVGSGGLQTIVRHIDYLQKQGATCDIFLRCFKESFVDRMYAILADAYDCMEVGLYPIEALDESYDAAIATFYATAPFVARSNCKTKCYFIQDFEPSFFAMGDEWLEAEATYRLGLKPITIGAWLAAKLHDSYGVAPRHTVFGVDTGYYHPDPSIERERAICAIYQPEKPRRCTKTMLESLKVLHAVDPEVKIYTYGSTAELPKGFEFVEHLGLITKNQCNELYNRCKVGLSMGSTNPSRIPFEMMAAGLPVVDLYGENNRYDIPNATALLAYAQPDALASAIKQMLDDEAMWESMHVAGVAYAADHPIVEEQEQFAEALAAFLDGAGSGNYEVPELLYTGGPAAILEECSEAYTQIAIQEWQEMRGVLASRLNASYLRMETSSGEAFRIVLSELPATAEKMKFYIWHNDDQSDLHICETEVQPDGTCVCEFAPRKGKEPSGRYFIHAYELTEDGERLIYPMETNLSVPWSIDACTGDEEKMSTQSPFESIQVLAKIEPIQGQVDSEFLARPRSTNPISRLLRYKRKKR